MKTARLRYILIPVFVLAACAGNEAARQESNPKPWQPVYEAVLQHYRTLFESGHFLMPGYFVMHDVDGDGTPELIVFHRVFVGESLALNPVVMHTFRDGELINIDIGGQHLSEIQRILKPLDNEPGIIDIFWGGDTVFYVRSVLKGDRLVVSQRGLYHTTPYGGWRYVLNSTEVSQSEFREVFPDWRQTENLLQPLHD